MNEKILQEVKTAYADEIMPWDQAVKIRILDFLASEAVDPKTASKILAEAIPNGYNEFEAGLVLLFPAHARITIARESSVCLYIDGVQAHDPELPTREALMADEYEWEGNTLRVWWD